MNSLILTEIWLVFSILCFLVYSDLSVFYILFQSSKQYNPIQFFIFNTLEGCCCACEKTLTK